MVKRAIMTLAVCSAGMLTAAQPPTFADNKGNAITKDTKMIITRNGSQPSVTGPDEWFTGRVRIDPIHLHPQEPSRVSSALVTFEPGARTNWHIHPLGQLVIVTAGKGWTQCEGEPRVEINAGDAVWCPPGHKHWHGATSNTGMSHIAIQELIDSQNAELAGKNIEWLEPVTDEQYVGSLTSED